MVLERWRPGWRLRPSYGSFLRSITVPTAVDAEKIEASYENGVLEVSLPKAPEVKPKKVEVSGK